jgi:2-polyprenyl-6-methoxyphenol hydroxylase-like FAD-dependent oxidoreductase
MPQLSSSTTMRSCDRMPEGQYTPSIGRLYTETSSHYAAYISICIPLRNCLREPPFLDHSEVYTMAFQDITIIGAGLCGLALSLFLKKEGIKSTIYELRPNDVTSAGAIMLSPNALRSLDSIGVYDRIKNKGYHFRDLTFRNNDHKFLDAYEMGNKDKYGYDALRVYRQDILDELKSMVEEVGIKVVYEKRYSHIVSEGDDGVVFAFTDGEQKKTDLLIGADGIHSRVREHIKSNVKPIFNNVMAINCAIPTAGVKFPFEPYQTPVSIHGQGGAFVLAAQNSEGSQLLGGIQYRTHDRSRSEWDALWEDKQQLLAMMKQDYDKWNPMVQSALDAIPPETIGIWAFHSVPHLDKWSSEKGRVVILGDAAHAIREQINFLNRISVSVSDHCYSASVRSRHQSRLRRRARNLDHHRCGERTECLDRTFGTLAAVPLRSSGAHPRAYQADEPASTARLGWRRWRID